MKKNERLLVIALVASVSFTAFSCNGDAFDTSVLANDSLSTFSSVASNILEGDFIEEGDCGGIIYTYISSTNTRYTVGVLSGNTGSNLTVFTKADVALNSLGLERY